MSKRVDIYIHNFYIIKKGKISNINTKIGIEKQIQKNKHRKIDIEEQIQKNRSGKIVIYNNKVISKNMINNIYKKISKKISRKKKIRCIQIL